MQKNYFVHKYMHKYTYQKLNLYSPILRFNTCIFVPTSRNGALILCFKILKNDFENSNKLEIILMFLFLKKI